MYAVFLAIALSLSPCSDTTVVVRPTDIDVKGHVNNARFVEYLQAGRWEWFDRKGLTNERLAELQVVLVVANIDINYRREVKYGETVAVSVSVEKLGDKSIVLKQVVTKAGDPAGFGVSKSGE